MFVVLKSVQRRTAPKTERNGFGQVNPSASNSNPRTDKLPFSQFWSPKQRTSIVYRFVNDLPYAEIGRIVGCSEAAARQNVRAGLASLRGALER